jgi:hypothetical protein
MSEMKEGSSQYYGYWKNNKEKLWTTLHTQI